MLTVDLFMDVRNAMEANAVSTISDHFSPMIDELTVGKMGINTYGFSENSVGCQLKRKEKDEYSFFTPIENVNNISLKIYVNKNKPSNISEENNFFNLQFKQSAVRDFDLTDVADGADFGIFNFLRGDKKYKKLPKKIIKLNFNEL